MEKETYRCVRKFLAQHLRKQNQMVVMDPDHVIRLVSRADGFRENSIRFDIGFPGPGIKFQL